MIGNYDGVGSSAYHGAVGFRNFRIGIGYAVGRQTARSGDHMMGIYATQIIDGFRSVYAFFYFVKKPWQQMYLEGRILSKLRGDHGRVGK